MAEPQAQDERERHTPAREQITHDASNAKKPLSFDERFRQQFPQVYLTLMSIVQGVAIYTLSTETKDYIDSAAFPAYLKYLPLTVFSFGAVVIVTFEYAWFVALFRWEPRLYDIAIPLGLGLFEVLPMYYFRYIDKWLVANALLSAAGALAYLYSLLMLGKTQDNQSDEWRVERWQRDELNRYFWRNIVILLLTAAVFLGFYRLYTVLPVRYPHFEQLTPRNTVKLVALAFLGVAEIILLRQSGKLMTTLRLKHLGKDHSVQGVSNPPTTVGSIVTTASSLSGKSLQESPES